MPDPYSQYHAHCQKTHTHTHTHTTITATAPLAVGSEAERIDRTKVALDRAVLLLVRAAPEHGLEFALARGGRRHTLCVLTTAEQHVMAEWRDCGVIERAIGLEHLEAL